MLQVKKPQVKSLFSTYVDSGVGIKIGMTVINWSLWKSKVLKHRCGCVERLIHRSITVGHWGCDSSRLHWI